MNTYPVVILSNGTHQLNESLVSQRRAFQTGPLLTLRWLRLRELDFFLRTPEGKMGTNREERWRQIMKMVTDGVY